MFMNLFLSILTLYCIYQSLTYLGFILVLRSGIRIQFSCPLAFLAAATGALSAAKKSYPTSEVRGGDREELPHTPTPEARGGGQEEQPHFQGAVAAWAQEGLEELSHIEGQEGR